MKYILEGNEKDVSNVMKEQRIRINRGLISITPITECGLITEEDAQKDMDEKLSELMASIADNEERISSLTSERDELRAHIAGLDASSIDTKEFSVEDSKDLPVADSKAVVTNDEKVVTTEEVKKPGRPRNSNKS